jgi:hypothetical protein
MYWQEENRIAGKSLQNIYKASKDNDLEKTMKKYLYDA